MNNPNLYRASLEALQAAGCPQDLAAKASKIVANDNPQQANLGRTPEETQTVNEAAKYLQD